MNTKAEVSGMALRFATPRDGEALTRIYGQYIDTEITFEYALPSPEEFSDRIREISAFYPYLVWEEDGRPMGYAYAHRAQERAAYQWNAELSVYLDRAIAGRGVGEKLYRALEEILALQGILTAYGVVVSPNPRSERLHEKMGYARCALWRETGYKNGGWQDVVWFEKQLGTHGPNPAPPVPVRALPTELVQKILMME